MQTTIRYFASVREAIGLGSETLDLIGRCVFHAIPDTVPL